MGKVDRSKRNLNKDGKKNISSALLKIERIDSSIERRFLIASIVSDDFNKAIDKNASIIKDLLPSKVSKTIFGWTSKFYEKYGVAINASLGNKFSEVEDNLDDFTCDDIKDVLSDISKQHSKNTFNWEYELEASQQWLDSLHIKHHNEEVEALVALKKFNEAKETTEGFKAIEWSCETNEYDPLNDDDLLREALEGANNPLFSIKGGFGDFVSRDMVRTGFVCFQAPDKAGKSWTLDNLLHSANLSKNNIVFKFDIGDLSKVDIQSRLVTEISSTPIDDKQCGEHYSPVADCVHNQLNNCGLPNSLSVYIDDVDGKTEKLHPSELRGYSACTRCRTDFKCAEKLGKKFIGTTWSEKIILGAEKNGEYKGLDFETGKEAIEMYKRRRRVKNTYFWNYPNNKFSCKDLRNEIKSKIKDGINPDVILIDYIDLMVPENNRANKIDQIDQIWKDVRALAQEFDCLIITVSQSDAGAYNNPIIGRENFSGSKLKLAHCTAMYSIQRMQADVEMGCCRYGRILSRFQEATDSQCVVVQDLKMGKTNIDSYIQSLDDLIQYHSAFKHIKVDMEEKEQNRNRSDDS